jgi:hypothetical protein
VLLGACGGGGSASTCPPFANVVAGDFGATADRLWWTLEVQEMPAELTFDQADVHDFVEEYLWGVDIDADEDGQTDLQAAVTHYREAGKTEVKVAPAALLTVAQADLWSVQGAASSTVGDVDVTLTGNTFRFEVAMTEEPRLAQVKRRQQSTWRTRHQYGPTLFDSCEDTLR